MEDVHFPVITEADCVDNKGQPILQKFLTDTLIHNEFMLSHGDDLLLAKALRRLLDDKGRVIGEYDENNLINTLIYDVEFPDTNIN